MDNLLFTTTADFYKYKEGLNEDDKNNAIGKLLNQSVASDKEGEIYTKILRNEYRDMRYSFIAYKRKVLPSCFKANIDDKWKERKFAYLFIAEYDDYVAICKRNIPTVKSLLDYANRIDYSIINSALLNEGTRFQRFGMTNLDVSDSAMRSKSVEAANLELVFPSVGANTFTLNTYRAKSGDTLFSINSKLSRINQLGGIKAPWAELLDWIKEKVVEIIECRLNMSSTMLSIFAQPANYIKEFNDGHLKASSILISLHSLSENNSIKLYEFSREEKIEVPLGSILQKFEFALDLSEDIEGHYYTMNGQTEVGIEVIVEKNGISLKSDTLDKYIISFEGDDEDEDTEGQTLLEYILSNCCYVIHFDDPCLRYTNNKLFKDLKLLGNINSFLDVFEEDDELKSIISEKGQGKLTSSSSSFPEDSLFGYVEKKYSCENHIMVCDDLGTEWADHILIGKDSVKLFAAKHKRPLRFSASAFQEVIGQAQKNLGIFYPNDSSWQSKKNKWDSSYILDKISTNIKRIRTDGKTAKDAIELWRQAMSSPNYHRDIYIVIDFISKGELEDRLIKLQNEESFREKKEAIPILWLLSTFISACQNMNVGVHITCCK